MKLRIKTTKQILLLSIKIIHTIIEVIGSGSTLTDLTAIYINEILENNWK
jgi:hypothetical protein